MVGLAFAVCSLVHWLPVPLVAAPADSQPAFERGADIKGIKSIEGNPEKGLRYRLRLSDKATPDKPHRLVIWLHPSGSSMNATVEALSPRLAEHGFALLILTQKDFKTWNNDHVDRLLQHTVPDAAKQKELDVRKPVLLGYSAGGQVALELWFADPKAWGGLILDAAYPVEPRGDKYLVRPLPKTDKIKQVPLLVLVGDLDDGAAVWKDLQPGWQEAGVPVTLRVVKGKGHTWLFGKDEVALLEKWLGEVAANKLPSNPSADGTK